MGRAQEGDVDKALRPLRAHGAAPARPLGQAWTPHRGLALAVVALSSLVPATLALSVTWLLATDWPRPRGFAIGVAWWLALAAVAWVIIQASHVVTRRLLPLAALLQMGLAFPGATPSRFRLALHAGNPRRLQRSLAATTDSSAPDDTAAAELMLELVSDLSDHDRSTRGHSERVRAYTELLAGELGITADDRQRLRWAGLLHDIGKLETPAAILNKPGALTDDEFSRIRQHPLDGLRLAMPLWAWLGEYVLAVSDHHERWEGGGYPSGVAGEDISLAGRIVAVADAFDVMTSSRSYKKPITVEAARAELVRCSGTQFDPTVVRAFLSIDLRSLRKVIGLLALVSPISAYHRRAAPWSGSARHALGAAGVATAVATWSVVAPVVPSIELAEAPVIERAPSGISDPVVDGAPDAPSTSRPPAISPAGPRVLGMTSEPAPLVPPASPDVQTPSRPTPPTTPPPPPRPSPGGPEADNVGLTVDPGAGSVEIDGIAPSGPIGVVELEVVGGLACDSLGVCQPISVELPLTLPF